MLFKNLGPSLSSDLIKSALAATYAHWENRYGALPEERLRTEIGIKVHSRNPGYCYKMAGWGDGIVVKGKLYLYAPRERKYDRISKAQGSLFNATNKEQP